MTPLQIAVTVGGKFSSEQAATALHRAGHSVQVFTSLPKRSFSPELNRHSFLSSEIVYRVGKRFGFEDESDLLKMRLFGVRANKRISRKPPPQVILGWSSFSKELFSSHSDSYKILVRESSHIEYQDAVLKKEHARLGLAYHSRTGVIARELAEYQLADKILVCSQFAKETFIEKGIEEGKIAVIPLGVDTTFFRPQRQHSLQRPLKLLFVGALSVRKGIIPLLEATKNISRDQVQLTCVGPVEPVLKPLLPKYIHHIYIPALAQQKIAPLMREFDAFVFPTLEDGYGSVLVQAMSSGLVPITTTHAGSSEWVTNLQNGILVEPGDVAALRLAIQRLALDHTLYKSLRREVLQLRDSFDTVCYQTALVEFVQSMTQNRQTVA